MKNKYEIVHQESMVAIISVEAENADEALESARSGGGKVVDHRSSDEWRATQAFSNYLGAAGAGFGRAGVAGAVVGGCGLDSLKSLQEVAEARAVFREESKPGNG